jgi:glycosyltransferase involved in cell wall biosynthesis
MKASVLIANYNGEKYIDDCIVSLKNQTFKDFEIIFFDDCSSDNSLNVISKYKNVRIITNDKRGLISSYNQMNAYKKAFEVSSGEYIFTLDSDDYYHYQKIEKVINSFNISKNLFFDLPIYIKNNKKIFSINKNKKIRLSSFPFFSQQSAMTFRRKIFEEMYSRIFINDFPDVWFDFRAAIYSKFFFGKVEILEDYLTFYRKTDNSISSRFVYMRKRWWQRRMQCHLYVKKFLENNNARFKNNLDFYVTDCINKIL